MLLQGGNATLNPQFLPEMLKCSNNGDKINGYHFKSVVPLRQQIQFTNQRKRTKILH